MSTSSLHSDTQYKQMVSDSNDVWSWDWSSGATVKDTGSNRNVDFFLFIFNVLFFRIEMSHQLKIRCWLNSVWAHSFTLGFTVCHRAVRTHSTRYNVSTNCTRMSVGFSASSCWDASSARCTDLDADLPTADGQSILTDAGRPSPQFVDFSTVDGWATVWRRGRFMMSISCW